MSSIVYDKQPTRWITWRGKHIPVDENGAIMKIQVKRQDYQDKKAEEKADKASLNYVNKNKELTGKWDVTEKDREDLKKLRKKSNEAYKTYEDRMRARYEQEEDDRNFENAYHKAHREKTIEAHNEYKSRSDRYAKKYGEEERATMFNKAQESRRNEVSGRKLTENMTPKERAREIDKNNLIKENQELYKQYSGFADTGNKEKNKEVEKAHKKWLENAKKIKGRK